MNDKVSTSEALEALERDLTDHNRLKCVSFLLGMFASSFQGVGGATRPISMESCKRFNSFNENIFFISQTTFSLPLAT